MVGVCWECWNVDVSALQDRETDSRGKRQEELIQLPDMSLC